MTASLTQSGPTDLTTPRVRGLAAITAAAGVVGVAIAAYLATATADPAYADTFSAPLDPDGYRVLAALNAVQHLGMLTGVVAVTLVARGAGRAVRGGLRVGGVGVGLLVLCELWSITAADQPLDSTRAGLAGAAYAVPMLACGVGLLVAGLALLRERRVPRAVAWLVTACGGYVFVGLFPAVFSGSSTIMSTGIGVWLALFGLLGVALLRPVRA